MHRSGGVGDVERQHELAHLARVAHQPGRAHVGSGSGGALGGGGDPDPGLAVRQRHQVLAADDGLDLSQPLPVVRQDGAAEELVLLQLPDHLSVVLSPASLGQVLHLLPDCGKRRPRFLGQLLGGSAS
jgi:hypothetical protein